MEFILIAFFAFLSSLLSLFSGFGLNSIMLPVFAVFFPVNIAVAFTAIVHFLNNTLKIILLGKFAEKSVVFKFGLPAVLTAFLGAWMLGYLSGLKPLMSYEISRTVFFITPVKLVIALIIFLFALFDLLPLLQKISFSTKFLPIGGMLSGFIGGLSGHQGGLRSTFLIKCNLTKEGFIGTGAVIAFFVDIARITVYSSLFTKSLFQDHILLLVVAIVSAFFGVFVGNYYLRKVTLQTVQVIVGTMLILIAIGMGTGLI